MLNKPLVLSIWKGPLELASAGLSMSIFNIISKVFNIPLLSVATSFVAEDISKSASKESNSGETTTDARISSLELQSMPYWVPHLHWEKKKNMKHKINDPEYWISFSIWNNWCTAFGGMGEKKLLPSVSTALLLSAAIGTFEALAMYLGSGIFLNIMGISSVSKTLLRVHLILVHSYYLPPIDE